MGATDKDVAEGCTVDKKDGVTCYCKSKDNCIKDFKPHTGIWQVLFSLERVCSNTFSGLFKQRNFYRSVGNLFSTV